MTSLAAKTNDVIVTDQSTWEPWYQQIKKLVDDNFWPYFDPDGIDMCVKLMAPIKLVLKPLPAAIEPPVSGSSISSQTMLADTLK